MVFGFVVAGFAAGLAVEEAVATKANVDLRLAHAAIFLAVAALFEGVALQAAETVFGGRCHKRNLAREREWGKFRW